MPPAALLISFRNFRLLRKVSFSYTKPGFFYPWFFLMTYQIADLFESTRDAVGGVFKLLKNMVS